MSEQTRTGSTPNAGERRVLELWEPILQAMVDASRGDKDAMEMLDPFFEQMRAKAEWRQLQERFERILGGDRDAGALLAQLDIADKLLVRTVLERLGTPVPMKAAANAALDNLLQLLAAAMRKDAQPHLAEQLREAAQDLGKNPEDHPSFEPLGKVILAVLDGKNDLDLAGLPSDVALRIRALVSARNDL